MSTYLEMVNGPAHLKKLALPQLQELAGEIRQELIAGLSKAGGHLGPNLGVVELTIALHRVFNTPKDKFVWDVSHQVYVHKILTDRKDRFRTIRNQSDPVFPSGAGVMVYPTDDGWTAQPGLPMHVQFLSPFTHLAALTDNALSVAGAPITMQDILTLGAAIRLAPTREVQRNSTSAQPDPRKATEVQAGAIANSVSGLLRLYTARINQEQSRLRMQFPEAEGGW